MAYAFIFIPMIYIFIVLLAPIAYNVWISFHSWSLVSGTGPRFIGFSNYVTAFTESRYSDSLVRTLVFVLITVTIEVVGGTALALFMHLRYPTAQVLRVILILPFLVSETVVGNMWRLMFDYDGGLINGTLAYLGIQGPLWLGPDLAFSSVIVADVWHQLPFVFLVMFAALQSVPPELSEAAAVDGAHGWRVFWNVTLPIVQPSMLLVLLFQTLYSLRHFSIVWILTEGGPANATRIIGVDVQLTTLQNYNIGMAATLSCLLLIFSLVIAVLYVRWLRRDPLS